MLLADSRFYLISSVLPIDLQEVLPDPFAERVVPKIDAVKEKYEQKKACEGRGRRRKLPVVKESKREGADVSKFFNHGENDEQKVQSKVETKESKGK